MGVDGSVSISSVSVRNRDCLIVTTASNTTATSTTRPARATTTTNTVTLSLNELGEGLVATVVTKANRAGVMVQGPKVG